MLRATLAFFVLTLIAAVFGFGGVAASAITLGKVLFFAFLVLAALTLVAGLLRK